MLLSALGLFLECGDRTADREAGAVGDQPPTDTTASTSTASTDTAGNAELAWGPAPPALPSGAIRGRARRPEQIGGAQSR